MKRHEQEKLLEELIGGEELSAFRQASLDRTLSSLRRQRRRRAVRTCLLASVPILLVAAVLVRSGVVRPSGRSALPGATGGRSRAEALSYSVPGMTGPNAGAVKFITDQELFALFPGRSMALIGKPGRQQLVFLDSTAANAQP